MTGITEEVSMDDISLMEVEVNADGTLSGLDNTDYHHLLATWAMELSYTAYNYPTDTGLPAIPGWFMGDVDYTAGDLLITHGFAENQIKEYNYDVIYDEKSKEYERVPSATGAHTIAYRNIELVNVENNNNEEQGADNNDSNLGIYQSDISESLYDCVCTVNTNTNALLYDLQLTEDEPVPDRPLVVVTVRGSVTLNDWINNAITMKVLHTLWHIKALCFHHMKANKKIQKETTLMDFLTMIHELMQAIQILLGYPIMYIIAAISSPIMIPIALIKDYFHL